MSLISNAAKPVIGGKITSHVTNLAAGKPAIPMSRAAGKWLSYSDKPARTQLQCAALAAAKAPSHGARWTTRARGLILRGYGALIDPSLSPRVLAHFDS